MITEVVMKRELLGHEISQKSKSYYLSATDLVRAGNRWRVENGYDLFNMSEWLRQKRVKEFLKELENNINENPVNSGKGRGKHTWVHPYVFIDMALAINPKLKVTVYKWLYDELLKYRNNSGDSYKKMTGALWISATNKSLFRDEIITIANKIKIACDVTDWQKATEKQLKLRDKIHEYIALFSDIIHDRENLIEISILKAKQEIKE